MSARHQSSLAAILVLTFLSSLGTGVLWSGLSFIAKHEYDYTSTQNFLLYIATAIAYIIAALRAGRLSRMLQRWLSPRGVLAMILLLQVIVSLVPLVWTTHHALWFVGCATSVLAATLWPLVESYLAAGRHGRAMRSAMGWWNVTWTSAVAVALLLMAPLISEQYAVLAIVALAPVSLVSLPTLLWLRPYPGEHDEAQAKQSITSEYPLLLRSVRILLPLSYVLIGTISPLMPYRLESLHVALIHETPLTAIWMLMRVIALIIMWRVQFWHGRWGALLLGGLCMLAGFAMIAAAPNTLLLSLGLATFGAGQGIIYYAALYYAMSVGAAQVDAGGTHEALIGVGYAVGPATALLGQRLPAAVDAPMDEVAGIVITVSALTLVTAAPTVTPYLQARRERREKESPPLT